MADHNNNSVQSSFSDEPDSSGYFIDDYSHLRLSYHREFNETLETDSSCASQQDEIDTKKEDDEATRRQKQREYWVSQMPDLPHPSVTMASMISSMSKKMGMVDLRYHDRVEPGPSRQGEEKFSPSRRSTLNCKQIPK